MIEREKAEKATQYLIDSARIIAGAKARATKAENMLRVVKSMAMAHSEEKSVAAREMEAYASDQYREAIAELVAATQEYEEQRALREAAKMTIEMFRSINANERGAERGYGAAA